MEPIGELVYLASPYTSDSLAVRERRYEAAIAAVALLMAAGRICYSPIVHCHEAAVRYDLPVDWTYWQRFCEVMLSRCTSITVLTLDGWGESKGIAAELAIAVERGLSVTYLDPKELA